MIVLVDYASPSAFESTREAASVSFAANLRRPVRFHATVYRNYNPTLRFALRALGEAIWSADYWVDALDLLDPVITVHPDRIFMEAFSQDQSSYACLIIDRAVFETEGVTELVQRCLPQTVPHPPRGCAAVLPGATHAKGGDDRDAAVDGAILGNGESQPKVRALAEI